MGEENKQVEEIIRLLKEIKEQQGQYHHYHYPPIYTQPNYTGPHPYPY